MPTAMHPQAKFDPLPPDLDLEGLVERTPNFKWVQRVSRSQIRNLGPQEFEKLVLIHVIIGGKPLVIDGWDAVLPRWLFNVDWFEKNYDKKQENVRDIPAASDIPMTTGHYLRSMRQLTNQWTPNNYRDERRQRLYLKDIDCPAEWRGALQKVIQPNLFYLNENVTATGAAERDDEDDDIFRSETTAAPAGDLMSSLPMSMRAENLMCYVGHEGTYTPAHREMCASLGQNIMVEASGDENGEKPGSSIWFMTESKDREVVREYFLSMLGHDIEIEKHFAQVNAWKKAPFDVYVVNQRRGDFILIPPLAAHQVWNRGTRTMKVAWNRTTAETLELALHEALPKARLVCRDEQYKNKAIIYFTLQKYYSELQHLEEDAERTQLSFRGFGQDLVRNSPRAKQLASDFRKLFELFTEVLVDEMFAHKEKDVEFLPFDSCVTCSYCRSNIFNRFLTCKHCVRTLVTGDEDAYDVCMECYAMGRSCACLSGLQWCEQWSWSHLVDSYETWRITVMRNDGFVDEHASPQPLEIVRQRSGKKSVAQICQDALRRRPWKDITKPERARTPSESEPDDAEGRPKKKRKRKAKTGDLQRCHVCCHKDYDYRVQLCTNPGCSEGYCYGVLYRAFDMMPQKVMEDEQWQCPKCLGICNCGYCRRVGNTNNPYTPKNTSLGHDTRPIADDRSVEALVDFRIHNLSWLKAGGEESRSKDSRRMQRLREQADNAKAQDLTEQLETEEAVRNTAIPEAAPDGLTENENGELHNHEGHVVDFDGNEIPTHAHPGTMVQPLDGEGERIMALAEEEGIRLVDEADASMYPEPPVLARQRIGMGYYEQDDTADRILFDPYQAPSADAMRLDQSDVSEFVKKSIRAAKRKAKRENEDPDYVVAKSHHKKPPREPETDFLDSMDPALFGEGPSAPAAVMDEPPQIQDGTEAAVDNEVPRVEGQPPRKKMTMPRFDANEPELRHARPMASYVEIEDGDLEHSEEENEASQEVSAPAKGSGNAIDLAANAVRALFNKTSESEPTASSAATPAQVRKKRGRPPKNATAASLSQDTPQAADATISHTPGEAGSVKRGRGRPRRSELPEAMDVDDDDEVPDASANVEDDDGLYDELQDQLTGKFDAQTESPISQPAIEKPRRGRPRRSGVTTIAAASAATADEDEDEDEALEIGLNEDSTLVDAPSADPAPRPRGRPRRSEPTPVTSAKKVAANDQFMSLAQKMALKGKSFKIGKRKRDSASATASPRPGPGSVATSSVPRSKKQPNQDMEPKDPTDGDFEAEEHRDSSTEPSTDPAGPRASGVPPLGGATVVRLASVESDFGGSDSPSASSPESGSDDDIPARGRGSAPSARGRGRGRGRGRPSLR